MICTRGSQREELILHSPQMDDGREYKMTKSREQHWRKTEEEGLTDAYLITNSF